MQTQSCVFQISSLLSYKTMSCHLISSHLISERSQTNYYNIPAEFQLSPQWTSWTKPDPILVSLLRLQSQVMSHWYKWFSFFEASIKQVGHLPTSVWGEFSLCNQAWRRVSHAPESIDSGHSDLQERSWGRPNPLIVCSSAAVKGVSSLSHCGILQALYDPVSCVPH